MDRYQVLTVLFKKVYPKYMHFAPRKLLGQYWQWWLHKRNWSLKKHIGSFSPAFIPLLILLFSMFQSSGGFSGERSLKVSGFCILWSKEYSVVVDWLILSTTEMHCYPRAPSTRTGVVWTELYIEGRWHSEWRWSPCERCARGLHLHTSRPLPTS